jgi:hypothetical protein
MNNETIENLLVLVERLQNGEILENSPMTNEDNYSEESKP